MKRTGTDINIMQRMIERKMNFFGHICRMQEERQVVFVIMDGKNKRGRPKRWWTDDLVDWYNKDICILYRLAMVKVKSAVPLGSVGGVLISLSKPLSP